MKTQTSHRLILAALISTLALSACGIRGELETPPPLWGEKAEKTQIPKSEN